MTSHFGGSLRLALKQSLADTSGQDEGAGFLRHTHHKQDKRKGRKRGRKPHTGGRKRGRKPKNHNIHTTENSNTSNLSSSVKESKRKRQRQQVAAAANGRRAQQEHLASLSSRDIENRRSSRSYSSSSSLSGDSYSVSQDEDLSDSSSSSDESTHNRSMSGGADRARSMFDSSSSSSSEDEAEHNNMLCDTDEDDNENSSHGQGLKYKRLKNLAAVPTAEGASSSSSFQKQKIRGRQPQHIMISPSNSEHNKRKRGTPSSSESDSENSSSNSGDEKKNQNRKKPKMSSSASTSSNGVSSSNLKASMSIMRRKRSMTVTSPLPQVVEWIENMSVNKQRRNIAVGQRVKVRFTSTKNVGRKKKKTKWYGGSISEVYGNGQRVFIFFDDGTSEVSDFPDDDIVVDDDDNGTHKVPANAFLPSFEKNSSERRKSKKDAKITSSHTASSDIKYQQNNCFTSFDAEEATSALNSPPPTNNNKSTVTESSFSTNSNNNSAVECSESSCSVTSTTDHHHQRGDRSFIHSPLALTSGNTNNKTEVTGVSGPHGTITIKSISQNNTDLVAAASNKLAALAKEDDETMDNNMEKSDIFREKIKSVSPVHSSNNLTSDANAAVSKGLQIERCKSTNSEAGVSNSMGNSNRGYDTNNDPLRKVSSEDSSLSLPQISSSSKAIMSQITSEANNSSTSSSSIALTMSDTNGNDGEFPENDKTGASSSFRSTNGRKAAKKANERISSKQDATPEDLSRSVASNSSSASPTHKSKKRDKSSNTSSSGTSNESSSKSNNKKKYLSESSGEDDGEESDSHPHDEEERWVQCDKCQKWRLLPSTVCMETLPDKWYCELNIHDDSRNTCSAPEQTLEEIAARKRSMNSPRGQQKRGGRISSRKGKLSIKSPKRGYKSSKHSVDSVSFPKEKRSSMSLLSDGKEMEGIEERSHKKSLQDSNNQEDSLSRKHKDRNGHSSNHVNGLTDTPVKPKSNRGRRKGSTNKDKSGVSAVNGDSSETQNQKNGRGRPPNSGAKKKEKGTQQTEWVQCEKCEKWRKLPKNIKAKSLPEKWFCSMNTWNVSVASCSIPEEKPDAKHITVPTNDNSANAKNAIPPGKLSYRNLIFGKGKKFLRNASEKTRAAESLFVYRAPAEVDQDTGSNKMGPPTYVYNTSSAFQPKQHQSSNNLEEPQQKKVSFLNIMAKSKLWEDLQGADALLALKISSPDSSSSNQQTTSQSGVSSSHVKNNQLYKDLILDTFRAASRANPSNSIALAPHEVLLEIQCNPSSLLNNTNQGDIRRYEFARASCSIEIVETVLLELLQEGSLVRKKHQLQHSGNRGGILRYCLPESASTDEKQLNSSSGNHGVALNKSSTRNIRISKPWKMS